jgi:hypothetical protein
MLHLLLDKIGLQNVIFVPSLFVSKKFQVFYTFYEAQNLYQNVLFRFVIVSHVKI